MESSLDSWLVFFHYELWAYTQMCAFLNNVETSGFATGGLLSSSRAKSQDNQSKQAAPELNWACLIGRSIFNKCYV